MRLTILGASAASDAGSSSRPFMPATTSPPWSATRPDSPYTTTGFRSSRPTSSTRRRSSRPWPAPTRSPLPWDPLLLAGVVDHLGRHRQHPGRHARHGHQPPGRGQRRPVATDDHGTTLFYRLLVGPLLRRGYADMAAMEDTTRRSGTAWTILRPPRLTDGPRTGTWRQARDANLRGGSRISRADLAAAILASLAAPDTVKATVAIGY